MLLVSVSYDATRVLELPSLKLVKPESRDESRSEPLLTDAILESEAEKCPALGVANPVRLDTLAPVGYVSRLVTEGCWLLPGDMPDDGGGSA